MAGRGEGLPLEPIWQVAGNGAGQRGASDIRGGALPAELAARFRGELAIPLRPDRPALVVNFVSSLDGVAALGQDKPEAGGAEISGHSDPDRLLMALLRSLADVVMIGAGTVRRGRRHEWTPRALKPELAPVFAAWRKSLGLAEQPTTVVVSATGELDFTHRGLSTPDVPVIVATTRSGAERLGGTALPHHVTVAAVGSGSRVPPEGVLELIGRTGARLALCEGGPHLFGELLRARLVDELFLTLAPQFLGRDDSARRLSIVEGVDLAGQDRWARLVAVRRAGDDLFLRYRLEP
jgi:riboflavin biosynthesis pyrimidine reductase